MESRSQRLAAYSALGAGLVPATTGLADIRYETDLNARVLPQHVYHVDFGSGFDAIFGLGLFAGSFTSSYYIHGVVQFLNRSMYGNLATRGSLIPLLGDDPANLGFGDPVSEDQAWYRMHDQYYGYLDWFHQVARRHADSDGTTTRGAFANTRGYLGLRFSMGDQAYHYAWIDISTSMQWRDPRVTVHGWGFETTPGVAILAGEIPSPGTSGLALLALGAAGIRRHRNPSR